ncbi:MAG: hypothetical protein ACN4G0_09095, partial [Polyangiales bacterium]
LEDDSDPATASAKLGALRAKQAPWSPHLGDGLQATAKVLRAASELGARDPESNKPPIWAKLSR